MRTGAQISDHAAWAGARVRAAEVGDIPAVQNVAERSWHATYGAMLSKQAIDRFLARAYGEFSLRQTLNAGGLFVLECEGGVAGYMRLGVNAGQGYLGAIYLLPEVQGRGLGKRLWAVACEWFRACELTDVFLSVAEDNARARRFYRTLGFVEGEPRRSEISGEPLVEITCHLHLPG